MTTESALMAAIVQALNQLGWTVVERLKGRPSRPDIVATAPDGRTAVIETKLGGGRAHFAQIAQMDSLATEARELTGASNAVSIIVTDMDIGPAVAQAANAVGVSIVEATGETEEVAQSVVDYLRHTQG
jgi:hypothetical protein